jgi:hypothetical protein
MVLISSDISVGAEKLTYPLFNLGEDQKKQDEKHANTHSYPLMHMSIYLKVK